MSEQVQLVEERTPAIVLRFDTMPATPRNLERMREQVRLWNERLAEAGAPFRLRVDCSGTRGRIAAGAALPG